jgi:predicted anti-sigma-YlaC factor YlaD
MKCNQARKLIQPLMDGALQAEKLDALNIHLDNCAECRAEAAYLRKINTALIAEPGLTAPQDFARLVARRAQEQMAAYQGSLRPFWLDAVTYAGMAVAIAIVSYLCLPLLQQAFAPLANLPAEQKTVLAITTGLVTAIFGTR